MAQARVSYRLPFGMSFGSRLRPFWDYFGLRGGPGEALGPLCAAPVRPHLETCYFCFILGSPWGPFWDPVGTNFRLWIRSAREGLASHFGPFLGVEGPHSVFTSPADPRNGQKTAIFEVADVAEV